MRIVEKGLLLAGAAFLALTAGCNDTALTSAPVAGDPPTAVITGPQTYNPLDTATFDGSSSYAAAGKTLTAFEWSITGRPAGSASQVMPIGTNNDQAEFFVDLAGNYKIKLKVTDSEGLTGETEYTFSATPSQDFHVELTWPNQYTQADMDLHLINKGAGGAIWNPLLDCYFSNCKTSMGGFLDWGVQGVTTDNPTLDIDNITDTVPENINIKNPANGTYAINVHYYASHASSGADIPVDLNVNVYLAGQLVFTGHKTLTAKNQVWYVGDVAWNNGTGTVTANDSVFNTTPM